MQADRPHFDYQTFEDRRERLANLVLFMGLAWLAILFGIALASDWFASIEQLKNTVLWGQVTVDRVLAVGAWGFVVVGIGGGWVIRNVLRPPQLFVVLRDFQSAEATELAMAYVRQHGATWGYWLTLENADLQAKHSLGGESEISNHDKDGDNKSLSVGSWILVSGIISLALITFFLLRYLNSAPLVWARQVAADYGALGKFAFPLIALGLICVVLIVLFLLVRWLLLTVQRALVLPSRIDSDLSCEQVLNTIIARARRRASTLTLAPMPVIAVDDPWWKSAVERGIESASLVIFFLAGRTSDALKWEIDHVREHVDPGRTVFVTLDEDSVQISDGAGRSEVRAPFATAGAHIDAVVRKSLGLGPAV